MNRLCLNRVSAYILYCLGLLFTCSNASAAFVDNFEDENADGWLLTSSGSGSTGVELHNASQMAYATHTGSGFHMLSMDFNYLASNSLSFDMHAVAYPSSASNAISGIELSFLNNLNVELGSTRLANATELSWIDTTDLLVDNVQHHYEASFSDFAALAGLGATDPISTLSISFFAQAQTTNYPYNNRSNATVWFDNVNVSAVPVPAAVWLFGSGLLGLLGLTRTKMV
jgi:hypothetical protein